jgi:hypothetical protein
MDAPELILPFALLQLALSTAVLAATFRLMLLHDKLKSPLI